MTFEDKEIRQELKYTISWQEYAALSSRLHTLLRTDSHAVKNRSYKVSSLYFDNLADDAWFDKDSGYLRRGKYRIRIYEDSSKLIRLELKEKFAQSTAKTSRQISSETYHQIISGRLSFAQLQRDPFLRCFYLKYKLENLRPRVIVSYIREAYFCLAGNVRVTFDKNLQTVINTIDLFAAKQVCASPAGYEDMIMEVKYDDFLPVHIKEGLRLARHSRLAISKYTICRELKSSLDWRERVI